MSKRTYGTGTVEQRGEKWRARVRVGGRLRQVGRTQKTREAAVKLLAAYLNLPEEDRLYGGQETERFWNNNVRSAKLVYFVRATLSGLIKIGTSRDARHRLRVMQSGSPEPLVLLGMLPAHSDTERILHRMFKAARVRGEWFTPSEKLLKYIDTYAVLVYHDTLTVPGKVL